MEIIGRDGSPGCHAASGLNVARLAFDLEGVERFGVHGSAWRERICYCQRFDSRNLAQAGFELIEECLLLQRIGVGCVA
jgi:hypothetical protein